MDTEMTIGVLVVICALVAIVGLVFWSRRTINRIAEEGFGSAREITRARRVRQ